MKTLENGINGALANKTCEKANKNRFEHLSAGGRATN